MYFGCHDGVSCTISDLLATILRFSGTPFRQPRDVHGAPLDDE